jgi:hypothetical protein
MRHASGERPRKAALARLSLGFAGRARGVTAALAAAITMAGASGCQTTMERSAELQRTAKHTVLASQGVSVSRESPSVRVLYSTVVRSSEATAVVVGLRNTSTRTLENAPIEITVRNARGAVLFQNNEAGLDPSLTRVSVPAPGVETVWVDDQVQIAGIAASASALVGEGTKARKSVPRLSVTGTHPVQEAGGEPGAAGTVANYSNVAQQHLVVFAVARKNDIIVAAARAILGEVGAGASVPFQVFFVGNPNGAQIQTSVPATTF